jgi:hypothetical protein
MRAVAKYNTFKGVSTALTIGTPIATLACCGDFFVHRADTAISAAGIFSILIASLFLKDKIAETFKSPSALILSAIILVLVCMVENIVFPIKCVCIATIGACGIDELTFKRWYKQLERAFPQGANDYKHFGFIFTSSQNLLGDPKTE